MANFRFPKLPQTYLKTPRGFKPVKTKDFKNDMKRLGARIADDFKKELKENIETNRYGFRLAENTIKLKGHDIPLIASRAYIDAIHRHEYTKVSVKDTPRTDSKLTNKELAVVHEYGFWYMGRFKVPARPVWRRTYRDFKPKAEKRVKEFFKKKGEVDMNIPEND